MTIHAVPTRSPAISGANLELHYMARSNTNLVAKQRSRESKGSAAKRKPKEKKKPKEQPYVYPETIDKFKLIPGHILEMLQPNEPSIDLIRAFNNYWSAQISHCAVCATFALSKCDANREMSSDWKFCTPTVLPDSSPIWVRHFVQSTFWTFIWNL